MKKNVEIEKYLDTLNEHQIEHLEILSIPSSYRNKNLKFLQNITYKNQDIFFDSNFSHLTGNEEVRINELKKEKINLQINASLLGGSVTSVYFLNSLKSIGKTSGYFSQLFKGFSLGVFCCMNFYFYKLNDLNNQKNLIFYDVLRRKIKRGRKREIIQQKQ